MYLDEGGDTDEIGTYLVEAPNAQRAADVALAHAQSMINCSVRIARHPSERHEYEAVLSG